MAESYAYEETVGNSLVVREPVGVVGCITPWNYPLHQIAAKVAYAMAAGCTVVLKPSEIAPLDAFILAEVIDEVGLPAGVFNLVTGTGPVVGEAIAAHPDVDMVSFTGSTRAGKRVAEVASQTLKRVALELGGKSANILLDDLDDAGFEKAVRDGVGKALPQLGPDLHRAHPHARARATGSPTPSASRPTRSRRSSSRRDPFADGAMLGPLSSPGAGRPGQRLHPEGHRRGRQARHRRHRASPRASTNGYFVKPTVFSERHATT